ncbi:MAG: hypothetical protein CVV57_08050 [Tenericutes bacterium HGW-Tenericutes-2]|jgi:hypothetical protein|nr:MAG: hypothetical protein CVV57_08050 [Tenericutes bacterium HGW-Tenericutes-2]
MKNYIDRYIYAVTKRLPESVREEVKSELLANINDMLPENPTSADIEKVLKTLGHPRILAKNYETKERYVISPWFYTDYIQTLKIVMIIVVAISVATGFFDAIINIEAQSLFLQIVEVFASIISNAFSGAIRAFAWVTIIFWIIDYVARNSKGEGSWDLKDLPDVPKINNKAKISKTESIIGLIIGTVFSIIFIIILIDYTNVIGIYDDGVMITQIFNTSVTNTFIIFFIISAIISIIVSLLKIYYGEWKLNLAILYTAFEILSTVLFLIFINHPQLILPEVFDTIAFYMELDSLSVIEGFEKGVRFITGFVVVVVFIDLTATWFKTLKSIQQNK